MCGRFSNSTSSDDVKAVFKLNFPTSAHPQSPRGHNNRPQWNIAPSMRIDTVTSPDHRRMVTPMTWGIATPQNTRPLINARSETMFEKPTFRDAARTRRCLVIASGWFEWKAPKQPYYIHLADQTPMAMAGLYWRDDGEDHLRCVIVTTAADGALASIHHRAPLVIEPAQFDDWLLPSASVSDQVIPLLRPCPAERFQWHPVSSEVGSTRVDHEGLIQRDETHGQKPEPQMSLF